MIKDIIIHAEILAPETPVFHLFPLVPPFSIEGELYRPRLKHTPRGEGEHVGTTLKTKEVVGGTKTAC